MISKSYLEESDGLSPETPSDSALLVALGFIMAPFRIMNELSIKSVFIHKRTLQKIVIFSLVIAALPLAFGVIFSSKLEFYFIHRSVYAVTVLTMVGLLVVIHIINTKHYKALSVSKRTIEEPKILDNPQALGDLQTLDNPQALGDLQTLDNPQALGDLQTLGNSQTLDNFQTTDPLNPNFQISNLHSSNLHTPNKLNVGESRDLVSVGKSVILMVAEVTKVVQSGSTQHTTFDDPLMSYIESIEDLEDLGIHPVDYMSAGFKRDYMDALELDDPTNTVGFDYNMKLE